MLDAKLAQTGQPRIVLEPTHQYVCFSPTDSAQVARLEALDLITSYNPVGEEGKPIPEPDEDSQGEILPLYSVVPIGFQFPEDIPYTKIYDVYIQSLGGAGSASGSEEQLSTDLFKDVLTQTLAATGHTSVATRAGKSQQEWNPSARFRFHVDVGDNSDTILPLKQLNVVVVVQGSNQKRYYTDADGRITVTDKFIGPVDYQVVWDSHHFVIRQGGTWTRRGSWCKGHTEPLDTVLTSQCGLDYFLAGSHRALTAYYTEPNLVPGLVREQKLLNIGIVDKETPFGWEGRYVPILTAVIGEHALTMYAKSRVGGYHSSKSAMQTTFHELGHASHYYKDAGSYSAMYLFGRRKDMESWANGVSYAYTRALLGEEYEWSSTTNEEYTRLIECLLLNGFTMEQIQYDFYGSDDWGHWQSRIRARSDKQISDRLVNLIFDNPNDYHFDMRDMAEVSDTRIRLYQPVRLSMKDQTPFSATWEITDGTGATILNNNTSQLLVCFTEPGKKTLRATVELAPGIEETFDKTVTVSNTSIVSVPGTAQEGYPVTVSVMDLEICPDAKVTEWSVVQGDATITPKTDRSAQYTFRQPGNMTVKLKIQFQPNGPEVECTAPIRVQPLDVYSVFGVINAPETYAYNTTYQAKYMGTETDVEIVDVEADHRTHYPYYPFDTWSYNKSTRTLSFLIPDHPLVFDYKLIIHYKVNGVEVEEPAILIVSNFPDTPASQTTDTAIGE